MKGFERTSFSQQVCEKKKLCLTTKDCKSVTYHSAWGFVACICRGCTTGDGTLVRSSWFRNKKLKLM